MHRVSSWGPNPQPRSAFISPLRTLVFQVGLSLPASAGHYTALGSFRAPIGVLREAEEVGGAMVLIAIVGPVVEKRVVASLRVFYCRLRFNSWRPNCQEPADLAIF